MKTLQQIIFVVLIIAGCKMEENYMNKFRFIKSSGGIKEYTLLKNGLSVLLMEDHSAPVVTFMVTYRVGSRNEAVGHTGSTHLLEHLMFKGSKEYNNEKGNPIWVVLQNVGATINATTWMDRTNYFELLPSEHLEEAVAIESDRMRNAFIRDEDRQPEMTVVRNEFERGENDPFETLDKNIWATAYQAHPYHHSTIGWKSDIEGVSTERLKEFYDTFYWPNNATVTIIGDFEEEEALKLVYKYFGKLQKSPKKIPEMYTSEPEQKGPRRFIIKRSGQMGIVGVAHKTPEGTHKDTYGIKVLSKILGSGKTSRFYKSIVDKGFATDIYIWDYPFHDNGLFIAYVFLTPETDHAEVEKIILKEYEKIKNEGVTEKEIQRAISKIRAETAFSRDGSYSIASNLNEAIAIGDWTAYTTYLQNIEKVTTADIKRIANEYLIEDKSTTGYFIPNTNGGGKTSAGPSGVHNPQYWRNPNDNTRNNELVSSDDAFAQGVRPTGISIAELVVKKEVLAGINVVTMKTGIKDVITIHGSLLGGDIYSPDENSAVAEMTTEMLDQGTSKRDKFEISDALEKVGASISFYSTKYYVEFSARCLEGDVRLVIELLAEQLRSPSFDADDLETAKKRKIGDLKHANENTSTRAIGAFLDEIYPEKHPNYFIPLEQQIEDVRNVTVDDLKKYHEKNYGSGSFTIVAVGDINNNIIEEAVKKHFAGWKESPLTPDMVGGEKAKSIEKSAASYVTIEEKTSVDMMIGQPIGINRTHKDYYPLVLGHYILGGNFSARLMTTVRDQQGLTYGIRSSLGGVDKGNDGYWYISATFAPNLLSKGQKATLEQLEKWIKNGVTKEELEAKKSTLTGSFKVGLATTRGLANQIIANIERGREISFLDEYPEIINAITLEQVNGAIRKYCNVEKLVTVAAGSIDEKGNPIGD